MNTEFHLYISSLEINQKIKQHREMVNFFSIYKPLLHGALKLVGMTTQAVEIEPGTVLNFWLPTETTKKMKNKTSKPAVVFLHGFAMDGILNWQFQVLALANKYAVYVPDFLFFGGSVTDRPERTVEFQSECMAKGLRKLGVEKCTVVGLSYGGMVGFKMAEMYPELVESMVVSCSVMALTESVSNTGLQRIGFSSWEEFLLPKTVEGVRTLFDKGSYNLPKLPKFICEDILEVHIHLHIKFIEAEMYLYSAIYVFDYVGRPCLIIERREVNF